jgi:hypothetical protein
MDSRQQDDLRSSCEALRKTFRHEFEDVAPFYNLTAKRYARWEAGDVDLRDEELTMVRLGMLAVAARQKTLADQCVMFAKRHQDAFMVQLIAEQIAAQA